MLPYFVVVGHAFCRGTGTGTGQVRSTEYGAASTHFLRNHPLSGQPALFAGKSCALAVDDSKLAIHMLVGSLFCTAALLCSVLGLPCSPFHVSAAKGHAWYQMC